MKSAANLAASLVEHPVGPSARLQSFSIVQWYDTNVTDRRKELH